MFLCCLFSIFLKKFFVQVDIDLTFVEIEDRMHITVTSELKGNSWWLSRRLLLRLLTVWTEKLEQIALPNIPGIFDATHRNIASEHSLALEFDGPKPKSSPTRGWSQADLLTAIDLTVSSIQTRLTFRGVRNEMTLSLSRRETHAFIEMLFLKSKSAGWLKTAQYPKWLDK